MGVSGGHWPVTGDGDALLLSHRHCLPFQCWCGGQRGVSIGTHAPPTSVEPSGQHVPSGLGTAPRRQHVPYWLTTVPTGQHCFCGDRKLGGWQQWP